MNANFCEIRVQPNNADKGGTSTFTLKTAMFANYDSIIIKILRRTDCVLSVKRFSIFPIGREGLVEHISNKSLRRRIFLCVQV